MGRVGRVGLLILGLASIAWASWALEIGLRADGGAGYAWALHRPLAAWIGIGCVVLAVASPAIGPGVERPLRSVALFCLATYPVAFVAFEIGRGVLIAIHDRFFWLFVESQPARAAFVPVMALGAHVLAAVGFTWALRRFLVPVRRSSAGWFFLALVLVLPLGVVIGALIPGAHRVLDYYEVVRRGIAAFSATLLMGLASWRSVHIAAADAIETPADRP